MKIRHYVVRKGRGYWLATPAMRALGLPGSVPCGRDGPEAWKLAETWNARWDAARRGVDGAVAAPLPGSLAEAFTRLRRTETWAGKAASTRLEWEAGWRRIEPIFGDLAPATISLEDIDAWYADLQRTETVDTAWRTMKTWRALWQAAAALRYCDAGADPSAGVRRRSPPRRAARWGEGEVVRLVKAAIRRRHHGLACIIAVAWDTQLSPGDVRLLTPGNRIAIGGAWGFTTGRAKTGRPAIGTLSARTRRLVEGYLAALATDGIEILDAAPLFRATDGEPYKAKAVLSRAFARLREALFPSDARTLMDMRRSGAVEAMAGSVDPGALAAKMANTINRAGDLQATYLPVDPTVVELADAARRRGRTAMRRAAGAAKPAGRAGGSGTPS